MGSQAPDHLLYSGCGRSADSPPSSAHVLTPLHHVAALPVQAPTPWTTPALGPPAHSTPRSLRNPEKRDSGCSRYPPPATKQPGGTGYKTRPLSRSLLSGNSPLSSCKSLLWAHVRSQSCPTSGSLPTQSLCLAPSSSSLTKLATHRPLDAIFIEELPHTSRLAPNATPAYSFKHSVVSLKAYYNNA